MKFLRPTAHVVSMIAPLILIAWLSSPIRAQTDNAKRQNEGTDSAENQATIHAVVSQVVVGSSNDQQRSETKQSYIQQWIERLWTDPIVALTIVLAILAAIQIGVYVSMHRTTQRVERAYVQPLFVPPGIRFVRFKSGNTIADVHMRVRNMGRTPARITNAVIALIVRDINEPVPVEPEYPQPQADRALRTFLVSDAEAFVGDTLTLTSPDVFAIREAGHKTIYAIGYVDYIDRFNQRHRVGTGNVYSRETDVAMQINIGGPTPSSNLAFMTQSGYNYDRKRKKSEGDDWDEPNE